MVSEPKQKASKEKWREYERLRGELERFEQLIAERTQYRFEGHGKTAGGNRRFISPARAWKMRCPGFPPSMHLQDVPECVHEEGDIPAACTQKTITIAEAADRKLRQDNYWGSPAWIRSYNRRSAVEATFGILKSVDDGGGVKRGWTRQVGLVKTSFLLAIYVAAQNLKMLLKWAARNGDNRDPLVEYDVTNYGFAEYDAEGNLIGDAPLDVATTTDDLTRSEPERISCPPARRPPPSGPAGMPPRAPTWMSELEAAPMRHTEPLKCAEFGGSWARKARNPARDDSWAGFRHYWALDSVRTPWRWRWDLNPRWV